MIKKFQMLLLKNTFAVVGPAIAVFLVLSIMLMKYPIFDGLECEDISGIADYNGRIQIMYESDTKLVTYQAKNLYYTGYNYYIDEKIKGAYYYSTDNGYMNFYLIETTQPESFIEEYKVKGEIIKDNVSVSHIVDKLVSASGIKEEIVEGYYSDFVISELDYPTAYIGLVYVLGLSPAIVCSLIILYTLMIIINPSMHSQAAQLEKYGKTKQVIKELNDELNKKLIYKRENVYITHNYLVISYLLKTEVVKLDMIKYMSKNLADRKIGFSRTAEVYRLTISNPGIIFYEIDFNNEEFIDEVVSNIRGI